MSQLKLFSDASPDTDDLSAQLSTEPLAYKVRESKRAKHVSIKISVEGEVEVVVPPGFERAKLPQLLEQRRAWIEKTRSRLHTEAQATSDDWQVEKPETIIFRWQSTALGELNQSTNLPKDLDTWKVFYQPGNGRETRCAPALGNRLTVSGNIAQSASCHAVLRKWLAHRAHKDLTPWLRQLGFDLDLPCRRISVRGQKTRWASCSSAKDISLNYKLLFLPRPLVHYVLVHELCHTVHMNHSKKFWALVAKKQPDYEQWRAQLKQGWCYVPRWVEN
ncbi:MAG: SprT family zinc-dependent metalloprotease [Phormidesmis sp.]